MKKRKVQHKPIIKKHHKKILLVTSGIFLILGGVYITRQAIFLFCDNVFKQCMLSMGFTVDKILIKETNAVGKPGLKPLINIKSGDPMLSQSTSDIFKNIKENNWVKDLVVHKGFPNTVYISVSYKNAVAIHQESSQFTLIDSDGVEIEHIDTKKKSKYKLPILTGEGSKENIGEILATLYKYPTIKSKLNALSYIRQRRWDIIIGGGIIVKLPEDRIVSALNSLEILLKQPNFNKNTVKIIDMRIKDKVIFSGSKMVQSNAKNKKAV